MEEWKAVKGYEGLYEVSSKGRLKSLAREDRLGRQVKERILKASVAPDGYLKLNLYNEGVMKTHKIHQLVAIAFLNHTPNGMEALVDHDDNDPLNNRVENLQIITQRENCSKDKKGTSKYTGVSRQETAKKWKSQIYINGKLKYLGYFTDELKASEAYQSALKEIA